MTIRHDQGLASPDDFIRDETIVRLVDEYQGGVAFCEHPDCDVYTDDRSELDRDYFCPAHSAA